MKPVRRYDLITVAICCFWIYVFVDGFVRNTVAGNWFNVAIDGAVLILVWLLRPWK